MESELKGQLALDLGIQDLSKRQFGEIEIVPIRSKSILTKASGFIDSTTYSINPYRGCQNNCNYCYAAAFSPTPEEKESWGKWVHAKANGPGLIRKLPPKFLHGKSVLLSSATDPYQHAEKTYKITRGILENLVPHQPKLMIQTRGPLLTRDIDLFHQFHNPWINISITTDDETIKHEFEPAAPSINSRLKAAAKLVQEGLSVRITLAPLLPIKDLKTFAKRLKETGVNFFYAQYLHSIKKDFAASTRPDCFPLLQKYNWSPQVFLATIKLLQEQLEKPIPTGNEFLDYHNLPK